MGRIIGAAAQPPRLIAACGSALINHSISAGSGIAAISPSALSAQINIGAQLTPATCTFRPRKTGYYRISGNLLIISASLHNHYLFLILASDLSVVRHIGDAVGLPASTYGALGFSDAGLLNANTDYRLGLARSPSSAITVEWMHLSIELLQ